MLRWSECTYGRSLVTYPVCHLKEGKGHINLPFLRKIEFKKSGQFIFFTIDLNSEENYDNKKVLQRPLRASGYYLQSRMDLKAHMPPLSSVAVASTLFYCTESIGLGLRETHSCQDETRIFASPLLEVRPAPPADSLYQ